MGCSTVGVKIRRRPPRYIERGSAERGAADGEQDLSGSTSGGQVRRKEARNVSFGDIQGTNASRCYATGEYVGSLQEEGRKHVIRASYSLM